MCYCGHCCSQQQITTSSTASTTSSTSSNQLPILSAVTPALILSRYTEINLCDSVSLRNQSSSTYGDCSSVFLNNQQHLGGLISNNSSNSSTYYTGKEIMVRLASDIIQPVQLLPLFHGHPTNLLQPVPITSAFYQSNIDNNNLILHFNNHNNNNNTNHNYGQQQIIKQIIPATTIMPAAVSSNPSRTSPICSMATPHFSCNKVLFYFNNKRKEKNKINRKKKYRI